MLKRETINRNNNEKINFYDFNIFSAGVQSKYG